MNGNSSWTRPALPPSDHLLGRLRRLKLGAFLALAVIVTGVAISVLDPVPAQMVRNATFDQFQRWQPRAYQDTSVRIVDIDDESLRRLGQWPWPRTRVAELVARLQEAGAAAIAFDVLFAEPDRTSPRAMLRLWNAPPAMEEEIAALPDHDEVLSRAIRRGKVVLGFATGRSRPSSGMPHTPARYVTVGEAPQRYVHALPDALRSLPVLEKAAAGNGSIAFFPDADGVVRRAPLVVRLGDELLPSLSAEALRVAEGELNYTTRTVPDAGVGLESIRIGSRLAHTTPAGEVWIHYTKPEASRYIPAWKLFAGAVPAQDLAGRILLIGTSAQGLMDLRFSPMGGVVPGVEMHAQILEQILTGTGISRPSWAATLELLIIVIGGLCVTVVTLGYGAVVSLAAIAATLALLWASAWQAFSGSGLLLDAGNPTIALIGTYAIAGFARHRFSEKRQRWVREAFSRYVSPNLVDHLIAHPEMLELGGRRQVCSFVFTDLADFTPLLEMMDPGEAVDMLNRYLDRMISIAFAHQGTLSRIAGDAVVIMFSAPVPQPDHQPRALACALEMQRFARQYAEDCQNSGIAFGQTRIGVHTGEVIVGNFGGNTIFDYRPLGDPVNTASRLEGVNKYLGTRICVSAATLAGCPEWPARPVGRVVLKGKQQPLTVFEPLDPVTGNGPDTDYRCAFDLMRAESPDALSAFEWLAASRNDDPLVALHLERLRSGKTGDLIVMTEK